MRTMLHLRARRARIERGLDLAEIDELHRLDETQLETLADGARTCLTGLGMSSVVVSVDEDLMALERLSTLVHIAGMDTEVIERCRTEALCSLVGLARLHLRAH